MSQTKFVRKKNLKARNFFLILRTKLKDLRTNSLAVLLKFVRKSQNVCTPIPKKMYVNLRFASLYATLVFSTKLLNTNGLRTNNNYLFRCFLLVEKQPGNDPGTFRECTRHAPETFRTLRNDLGTFPSEWAHQKRITYGKRNIDFGPFSNRFRISSLKWYVCVVFRGLRIKTFRFMLGSQCQRRN